jgi:hypothetical protein
MGWIELKRLLHAVERWDQTVVRSWVVEGVINLQGQDGKRTLWLADH